MITFMINKIKKCLIKIFQKYKNREMKSKKWK